MHLPQAAEDLRLPTCSVIIATLDRVTALLRVLECLELQTVQPAEVVLSVAGDATAIEAALAARSGTLQVRVTRSPVKSSARQRNQAAAGVVGEVLAFLDDDIEFGAELFERVLRHFAVAAADSPGGLSPRISNQPRKGPGSLVRAYYRLQAGYADRDYGGRLFGPGINCFPVFRESGPEMVPVEWLPSTCLFLRAGDFHRHQFPEFEGYSFAEDLHLTARIAREAPLFFLREPSIIHHSQSSEFKADVAALTSGKLHNMARVAREVMQVDGFRWRWELHRLFLTAVLLLRRPARWREELRGVWRAKP